MFLTIVALWFLSVVWFAVRDDSQSVVVGLNAKNAEVTRTIECRSPLSSSPGPKSFPTLTPPLAYPANPCPERHRQDRRLVVVDVVVFLALMAGGLWVLRRLRRPHDTTICGPSDRIQAPLP